MSNIKNTTLIDAAYKKKKTHVPVWLMRQAGRYLPQYQKIREKYDFLTMIHTPELAAEITVQPVDEFSMDAAILFSDILTIPEAMNANLVFKESGPFIERSLKDLENRKPFLDFPVGDVIDNLSFVSSAIHKTKDLLNNRVPLIGFAGSPFTVLSYMIEGRSTKTWRNVKTLMYSNPSEFHSLMDQMTRITIEYLKMQIKSGVDAVQIFDSWAGILSTSDYHSFSWKYIHRIIHELKSEKVPVFVFLKGIHSGLEVVSKDIDVLSLDWGISLRNARKIVKENVTLQGNLDPGILYGTPKQIKESVFSILKEAGKNHIFNLGHGIYPDTPVDSVKILVDTVHEFQK